MLRAIVELNRRKLTANRKLKAQVLYKLYELFALYKLYKLFKLILHEKRNISKYIIEA